MDQALADDDRVFVLGRGRRRLGRRWRVPRHRRPVDQARRGPRPQHADLRGGDHGRQRRRRDRRHATRSPEIMFMDFLGVAFDQLANHAAKLRYMSGGRTPVPLTVRVNMVGGTPIGAQHSQSLEALLMHTPGLKVVFPSTPVRRQGPAARLHRGRGPVRVHREHRAVHEAGHGADRAVHDPDRQGRHPPCRRRRHDHQLRAADVRRPQGRRASSTARASRPRSSTCARSPRSTWTRCSRRWPGPRAPSSSTRRCGPAARAPRSPPACTRSCTTSSPGRCAGSRLRDSSVPAPGWTRRRLLPERRRHRRRVPDDAVKEPTR